MRVVLLLVLLFAGDSLAWVRRRPCASNGMSCSPGPCCKGTKCDGDNVCRKPEKEWSTGRNPNEPGPDDPPKKQKEEKK
ncbi:MAG: hypothetical protein U0228_10405 [Myxococcaceae bacterium]